MDETSLNYDELELYDKHPRVEVLFCWCYRGFVLNTCHIIKTVIPRYPNTTNQSRIPLSAKSRIFSIAIQVWLNLIAKLLVFYNYSAHSENLRTIDDCSELPWLFCELQPEIVKSNELFWSRWIMLRIFIIFRMI